MVINIDPLDAFYIAGGLILLSLAIILHSVYKGGGKIKGSQKRG